MFTFAHLDNMMGKKNTRAFQKKKKPPKPVFKKNLNYWLPRAPW